MILMILLCILTLYHYFKLRKIDKERSEGIASIAIFSTVLNILPIEHLTKRIFIIIISLFIILLCRMSFKNIDIEKKKESDNLEVNNHKD